MIKIRDYNYKILNDKICLGIELDAKGENYYKNSFIAVNFFKDNAIIKQEEIIIPTIIGEGILYIGKEIIHDFSFDSLNLNLNLGNTELETSYYDRVEFSFDKEGSTKKKLVYKFLNHTGNVLDKVVLNLTFYNKGSLVCGSDVIMENLYNERTYYFEYEVSDELEYTEVYPFLLLPNTNELLFHGFYKKYKEYKNSIANLSVLTAKKEYRSLADTSKEQEEAIKKLYLEKDKVKKIRTKSLFGVCIINGFKISWAVFKSAVITFLFFVGWAIVSALANLIFNIATPSDLTVVIVLLIIFLIALISFLVEIDYVFRSNYISPSDKQKSLDEVDNKINLAKIALEEYKNNENKRIEELELLNREIYKFNMEVDNTNARRQKEKEVLIADFNAFKAKYPKYSIVDSYSDIDFRIVDDVIDSGVYLFEAVEEYRKSEIEKREALLRYKKEIELKEQQNRLQQEQIKAVRELEEQQKRDAEELKRQMRHNTEAQIKEMQMQGQLNYYRVYDAIHNDDYFF